MLNKNKNKNKNNDIRGLIMDRLTDIESLADRIQIMLINRIVR